MPAVLPFLRVFFYFFAGSSKNRSSEFNLLTTFMRIFFLIRCKFIIPSHYFTQLVGSSASSVRSFSEVFSRLVSVCNRKKVQCIHTAYRIVIYVHLCQENYVYCLICAVLLCFMSYNFAFWLIFITHISLNNIFRLVFRFTLKSVRQL